MSSAQRPSSAARERIRAERSEAIHFNNILLATFDERDFIITG
jgi:hypothetical protein